MSNRAVIVGGFATGKRVLEPVADAVCSRFGFADADVFRFTDALDDPSKLNRAIKRQAVFVHSAGLFAVRECTGMERIMACNSPEPTRIGSLVARAAIKSSSLWKAVMTGPRRDGAARVIATNTIEATSHPVAHVRQIPAISQFSTVQHLGLMRQAGVQAAQADTAGDEFFGPYSLQEWNGERIVLPGCHDQVLMDPVGFVSALPEDVLAR